MSERFLKLSSELPLNVGSMPVRERDKKDLGVWFCRANGPILGELFQVGMMILRGLDMSKLADDEHPPFWAFVGLLEWIKECTPEQEAVYRIVSDLHMMYPSSPRSMKDLLGRIAKKKPELALATLRVTPLLSLSIPIDEE